MIAVDMFPQIYLRALKRYSIRDDFVLSRKQQYNQTVSPGYLTDNISALAAIICCSKS